MRGFAWLPMVFLAGCGESVFVGPNTVVLPPLVDGQARLDFELVGQGRRFSPLGLATDGGTSLDPLPGHNAFWFAWSAFHPGTAVFGDDLLTEGNPASGSAECTVPCEEIFPACSGRDCIPSLQSPRMVRAADAPGYLVDGHEVMGILTSEGPRAYPHNILWWHEVINESVGGRDFAITFCPLTGSGLAFDRSGFVPGERVELGVSGQLYNSNLILYDRADQSWWSQMRLESVLGPRRGQTVRFFPVFEMTWGAWRALYPETLVVSGDTGHARNYQAYPYGRYRTDNGNSFRRTNPTPDPRHLFKDMTFGLFVGDTVKAYVWEDLQAAADDRARGVVQDLVGGVPVAGRLRPRGSLCSRLRSQVERRSLGPDFVRIVLCQRVERLAGLA